MAQGTLRDDKNAISSHLPSVRGGFSGKIVTDGNPSTLLCPNPSEMTNAQIMQQCRTQCNVDFFDLVHINDHLMSFNHAITSVVRFAPHTGVIRVRVRVRVC